MAIEHVVLSTGLALLVRPLLRSDRPALEAALVKLSPSSRRARFMGHKSSFSEEDFDFLLGGGSDHLALAAWAGGDLVAEARLVRSGGGAGEIALGVIDPLQRRGIGSLLIDRLRQAGRERGIERL